MFTFFEAVLSTVFDLIGEGFSRTPFDLAGEDTDPFERWTQDME